MFKKTFCERRLHLTKAFNEEVAKKESGWLTKMRHRISNLILNTSKVVRDEIDKKEKNKYKFLQIELRNNISKYSKILAKTKRT